MHTQPSGWNLPGAFNDKRKVRRVIAREFRKAADRVATGGPPDLLDAIAQREATAYHEAGHAVAGCCFRIELDEVSIAPTDLYEGHVSAIGRAEDDGRESMAELGALIVMTWSGLVAEARFTGAPVWISSRGDISNSLKACEAMAGGDEERGYDLAFEMLKQSARLLWLPQNWAAVSTLAATLLERETLTGAETRRIVSNAREQWWTRDAAGGGQHAVA